MHSRTLRKPDGRALHLYSHHKIPENIVATSPRQEPLKPNPHLRWHPLRAEWVAYASHRQDRTFLPPKDYSPLAVTKSPEFPTELPPGDYEVAVFENLFPSFHEAAKEPPELSVPTRAGLGACEVVVFTQDPDASLASLPVQRIDLILEVLGERTKELSSKFAYVMPFENRGVEMGVTLFHPHGQIYAYSFLPPVPARQQEEMKKHWKEHGTGILAKMLREERNAPSRMVLDLGRAAAFVPVCARYPYELWVLPERPVPWIHELTSEERHALAETLQGCLRKLDLLWDRPMPYLMVLHQAPHDSELHPEAHAHFEIYPAFRSNGRLKFLAGTELGAGVFVNDSLPEEKAAELRAVHWKAS